MTCPTCRCRRYSEISKTSSTSSKITLDKLPHEARELLQLKQLRELINKLFEKYRHKITLKFEVYEKKFENSEGVVHVDKIVAVGEGHRVFNRGEVEKVDSFTLWYELINLYPEGKHVLYLNFERPNCTITVNVIVLENIDCYVVNYEVTPSKLCRLNDNTYLGKRVVIKHMFYLLRDL